MPKRPTNEKLGQRVKRLEKEAFANKQAEDALRESERRFRTLIETAPTVILHLSTDGTILDLNPEAERFYGFTRAEALGQDYLKRFVPEEARESVRQDIDKFIGGDRTRSFENPITVADGRERLLSWDVATLNERSQ